MAWGTFWDILRFSIDNEISEIVFLVDQNGQTRLFKKKFFSKFKLGFFRVSIPLEDERKIFEKQICLKNLILPF
jgi:hypothetical protein